MKQEDSTQEPLLPRGGHEVEDKDQGPSGAMKVFWYLLMLLIHCGWGILPVNARYLQTKAEPPLGAFRLGFYIAGFAAVSLLFLQYIPTWIWKVCSDCCRKTPPPSESQPHNPWPWPRGRFLEWLSSIAILAVALGALAFGQICATNFTSGDWVQLISMTAPLFVALLASVVLGIPVPGALYPTLVGVLAGAGLVIYGGMQDTADPEGMTIDSRDLIGFGIALVATLGMAVFYVFVQKTEGLVGEDQVLVCEYMVMCLSLPPLSVLFEPPNWDALLHYDWVFWAHMIFCSVLVYFGCNLVQQFVIRNVGANVYAMTAAVRLVVSVAASWVLLGEKITSWMQWSGCFMVMSCISAYLYIQFYGKYDEVQAEAVQDPEDAPVLPPSVSFAPTTPIAVAPPPSEPVPILSRSQASREGGPRSLGRMGSLKDRAFVGTPGSLPC